MFRYASFLGCVDAPGCRLCRSRIADLSGELDECRSMLRRFHEHATYALPFQTLGFH